MAAMPARLRASHATEHRTNPWQCAAVAGVPVREALDLRIYVATPDHGIGVELGANGGVTFYDDGSAWLAENGLD